MVFAVASAFGVLRAEERALPNPEVLKWQFEAQERERAINRRTDARQERRRTAKQDRPEAHTEVVYGDRSAHDPR